MRKLRAFRLFALCVCMGALIMAALCGCGAGHSSSQASSSAKPEPVPIDDNTTDQMYNKSAAGETLDVVVFEGRPVILSSGYELDGVGEDVKEGHFYRVVADVEYLNGGIAGYVNYPDVKDIHSVKEVSIDDLQIPSIEESRSGFVRLNGYGGADYLFVGYGKSGVYKDGAWLYSYKSSKKLDDGSIVLCKNDLDEQKAKEGIANGVYCCEDYFLMPKES
ncbi:MAG: hypothetical protein IKF78_05810 [Atopobiaceae bacterium]|nr:hypothetical protein [Atopobiaceae bacterium]